MRDFDKLVSLAGQLVHARSRLRRCRRCSARGRVDQMSVSPRCNQVLQTVQAALGAAARAAVQILPPRCGAPCRRF